MRRILLVLGVLAATALSTVSASTLGNLDDVSLHQDIRAGVDPCAHGDGEPDPCPAAFTPFVPDDCPGTLDDYNVLVGTDGDDVFSATSPTASLRTTNGADLVFGLGGDDTVWGGNQDDCLVGGAGRDILYGENGKDVLLGGDGDDDLHGGNGVDILDGGDGDDTCSGDLAMDTYRSCETSL